MTKTITLTSLPGAGQLYPKAVAAMLPVIGKPARVSPTASLPDTTYRIENLRIDQAQLAEYCRTTGLQFGATVPLPFLFVLQFPLAMSIMVSSAFPFGAVGSVHLENTIERLRTIGVDEPLTISAHAENLREHRKGMLVDVVSEFHVGRELVAVQTGTFLKQQRTSLSDGERGPAPKDAAPPPPDRVVSVDLGLIRQYANASGDRNPIHMADLTAKAFGFSTAIAHGMWSAAAVLANVEAQLPDAVVYSVRFGKPILLPATLNMYTSKADGGYDFQILHRTKGYPHLTATARPRD
ncbi:MaoC/PaaZ C-terminal domain-containing protein [Gordonia hydrophobica]|uniref:MaoC/PaaZ C-terminal domain-containing protein n=1 Tax=Gordonia hydrophobica TaxID=40516 RepID=A0ABZ2U6Y3_9ACTN|nr:MaoC/PaaZ C-terminal domain-containing protein [Gordonia hydrophobica]MBM7365579.1 acyl dehydratase [Gordonia hydrophobica]